MKNKGKNHSKNIFKNFYFFREVGEFLGLIFAIFGQKKSRRKYTIFKWDIRHKTDKKFSRFTSRF